MPENLESGKSTTRRSKLPSKLQIVWSVPMVAAGTFLIALTIIRLMRESLSFHKLLSAIRLNSALLKLSLNVTGHGFSPSLTIRVFQRFRAEEKESMEQLTNA